MILGLIRYGRKRNEIEIEFEIVDFGGKRAGKSEKNLNNLKFLRM